jgi:Protein of unknown function (DUF2950)
MTHGIATMSLCASSWIARSAAVIVPDSLVQTAESFDVPVLKEILGPDSTDLVSSEDPVEDKNRAVAFAAKAKEKNSVAADPKNPNRAILTVGNDDFPFADSDREA